MLYADGESERLACAGFGLVDIMWGPDTSKKIATLTHESHLIAHSAKGRPVAQGHCAGNPLHLIHNGDRTRVCIVTSDETLLEFKVYEPIVVKPPDIYGGLSGGRTR